MNKRARRTPRRYGPAQFNNDIKSIRDLVVEYRYLRVEQETMLNNLEVLYNRVVEHAEQLAEGHEKPPPLNDSLPLQN